MMRAIITDIKSDVVPMIGSIIDFIIAFSYLILHHIFKIVETCYDKSYNFIFRKRIEKEKILSILTD
jgi:hypothetical protein